MTPVWWRRNVVFIYQNVQLLIRCTGLMCWMLTHLNILAQVQTNHTTLKIAINFTTFTFCTQFVKIQNWRIQRDYSVPCLGSSDDKFLPKSSPEWDQPDQRAELHVSDLLMTNFCRKAPLSEINRTKGPNYTVTNQPPKANSAFHPSGVGKWVPASAGKAKAGMVHSVSGW